MAHLPKSLFLSHPKKIFAYLLSFTITAGLVQQADKIVVRFAHTIYPYSLGKHSYYVCPLIDNDDRPPYIVNPSVFKTPQSTVLVSHHPEKEFVFRLLEHSEYLDSWIKSPDKGFYSIDYEFWKGGKDRVRRGFNPDFFIKINLDEYIAILKKKGKVNHLEVLKGLQDKGIEILIRAVEIKSDEDDDEATPAKAEWAKAHFEAVNKKLQEPLPANFDKEYKQDLKQFYTFDLLKPEGYAKWFNGLCAGELNALYL